MKKIAVIIIIVILAITAISVTAFFIITKKNNVVVENTQQIIQESEQEEESIYKLKETIASPLIEVDGEIKYKISVENPTEKDLKDFKLLDILPFNGDERGSAFTGDYTVSNVEIKQNKVNKPLTNDNLNLYATTSDDVRKNISVKDDSFEKLSMWYEPILGEKINRKLTGLAVTGTLKAKSNLEIVVSIKTSQNSGKDIYKSTVTAQMVKEEKELQTDINSVNVARRIIEGKIWLDSNEDGIISDGENGLENVQVVLVNEDGSQARNLFGEEIPIYLTDTNGYYKFENLACGRYKVKINYGPGEVTLKEKAGEKINNKFNENDETDLLDLSDANAIEIKKDFINAGIIKRKTKIKVQYIEKDTNEVLEEYVEDGIVKQEYKTQRKDIDGYQKAGADPDNAEGKMTRDVITIKYYYEKIPVKLIVKYRDIDGRDITSRDEEMHIIGDTYKTLPKEIENYHYERVIGEEEGILGKEGAEIVYIYKRKDAKVIVKYIEKNTNRILYEDIIEGKVGDSYKTDTIQIPGYKVANGSNTNYTGIMTEPTITEKYYYEKIQDNDITNNTNKSKNENIVSNTGGTNAIEPEVIKTATIIIKHVDENGNEIHKREEEIKNVGDKYKTYPLDIEGYVFDKVLGTAEGTLSSGGARITYQYKKQDATLVIRYLEKDTNRIVSNEDFIPYKLYSEYRTSQKEIDNFKFSGDGAEVKEGKMNKDIEYVTYYYEKIPSTVVIKYLTKDNEEPIKEEKIIQGYVGEKYIILRDKIAGYEALEETPERTDGTFSTATSYYTFYYKKLRQGKVIVKYINLDKKSEIEQAQEFEGYIGETYNIEPKKIKGFEVASDKMPENREGEFKEEDIEVKYYYRKVERVVLTDDVEFDETENVINTESGKNSTNINNYVVIILGIGIIILAIVVFYKIIRLFKKQ